MPPTRDIPLQRNEDLAETWYLTAADGSPIDLTGCSVAMQVKSRTDNASVVAAGTITIVDATHGELAVRLKASGNSPLANYGSPIQTVNLRYDVVLTYPDGISMPLVTGKIILSRGVTQP